MAKIENVDYEAIPAQAKSIRSSGQQLNTEMKNAYQSVSDMHTYWYGTRYNELVKSFNKIIPTINEMLELVVKEIPVALETVANNYSQADKGKNATSVDTTGPNKITTLAISNDVGMKFISSNVSQTQSRVSTNFKNAKEQMNKIESAYNRIKWTSEAATAFKSKFTKLKNDVVTALQEIETQFSKSINQTQQDIQNAESKNTVN